MQQIIRDYDPYNPLPLDEHDIGLFRYLEFEDKHRAAEDYNNNKIDDELRNRALLTIFTVSLGNNAFEFVLNIFVF